MEYTWFDMPTQVIFREGDDERCLGGIAYQDFVICGECGSTIPLEDCEYIEILSWVDISNEILGNEG